MALPTRVWTALTVACSILVATAIFAGYRTLPGVGDPIGRPVQLAGEIVASAGAFDHATADLVGQHTELGQRILVLEALADVLVRLETGTAQLSDRIRTVQTETTAVATVARPLPGGLATLGGPVADGSRTAVRLQQAATSLAVQLDRITASLTAMLPDAQALVPRATAVADRLDDVEEDTRLLGLLQSLLSQLGGR
jgi:hypothetical protein